jgi:hypothetical protein
MMALLAKEYGLMDIGSAGAIVLAGYVLVGIGLVAIGQIDVIWDSIENRYIEMILRFMYNADMNMAMGISMDVAMNMDIAVDMNTSMKAGMLIDKQDEPSSLVRRALTIVANFKSVLLSM